MARGGARPGAGRKADPTKAAKAAQPEASATPEKPAEPKTPLEYMLAVMNDPKASAARRDRMAIAAAPFQHARMADAVRGKKEQADDRAKEVSSATLDLWGGDLQPRTGERMN